MPIRLNLLAETQAAEELRRRDPVKRAIWVAAVLVSLALVWSSSLQLKAMIGKSDLASVEAQMSSYANNYKQVLDNEKKADEIKSRLAALQQLSTNRFFHASLLNALQLTNVDDVQLVRLRTEQTYVAAEAVKARTNANSVIPAKPATMTEKVAITLEGNDSSLMPGDQVHKYKDAVAGLPYFQAMLGKNLVNLKHLGEKQYAPTPGSTTSRESVSFTLECRFPDKTR